MRLVLQKRRRHFWGRTDKPAPHDFAPDATMLGKVVDTPTPCSCWMCRSPRRSMKSPGWKLTIQEQRAGTFSNTTSTYVHMWRVEP